jgi:hypothetical protein
MHRLKLYESVVIGNFLYGLGASVRAKSKSETVISSINLLQQTPADTELADVLIKFSGLVRIVEFKTFENKDPKEYIKWTKLNAALKSREDLIPVSRSVHWFVETDPQEESFISRIVPYLYAYPRKRKEFCHDLAGFIEDIAEEAMCEKNNIELKKISEYLAFLKACQGKGRAETGGLILAINSKGKLMFGELSDMLQLRMPLREFIFEQKKNNEIQKNIEEEYYKQEKQNKIEKKISREPSL